MAEWWLLAPDIQDVLAAHLDAAASRVCANFDRHGSENRITGALCQELAGAVWLGGTQVAFSFRGFSEQTEEPDVGADGGFLVTVTTPHGTETKGVLFQAKMLRSSKRPRDQRLSTQEARRLRDQSKNMLEATEDAVGLFYTRGGIYVVDAEWLTTAEEARAPMRDARLTRFGTYLGKWVARCTRGDGRAELVGAVREPSKMKRLIEMKVKTPDPPMLTSGSKDELAGFRVPRSRQTARKRSSRSAGS